MKSIVILGAGQMGKNAELLLNKSEYKLMAFGDNAADRMDKPVYTGTHCILPISEALALDPDLVFVAVASKDRGMALEKQARDLGYKGKLVRLDEAREAVDMRSAVTKRIAERIHETRVPGSIAELGVYQGDFACMLNELFPERSLYLFDTFEGFDQRDMETEKRHGFSESYKQEFSDTSEELVLARMPYKSRVILRNGFFPETTEGLDDIFAFVSLDADLYAPTLAGLEWFWPRLSPGGAILLHDYSNPCFPGVKHAVTDFEMKNGRISLTPLCDMHGSAVIMQADSRSML
ncbi:MAG TPA: TylF/MycF/NovP-related O-methyltransferase [Negativicutes bacterium]|nr:TylF/MycF/NovP-related O-methyltransferase [Negativicutes bacterium]